MLLERLGHDLWTESALLADQTRVLVPLLRNAWTVPLSSGAPFRSKAAGLLDIIAGLGPRYAADHTRAIALATRTRRCWPRPNERKWSVTVTHTRATCSGVPTGGR